MNFLVKLRQCSSRFRHFDGLFEFGDENQDFGGGPWTTCMLLSPPMMTTLSMIKLLINNNSWIFVNFSLNESEIV